VLQDWAKREKIVKFCICCCFKREKRILELFQEFFRTFSRVFSNFFKSPKFFLVKIETTHTSGCQSRARPSRKRKMQHFISAKSHSFSSTSKLDILKWGNNFWKLYFSHYLSRSKRRWQDSNPWLCDDGARALPIEI